ncbi:MAG: peroxiredoxin [bacterium]
MAPLAVGDRIPAFCLEDDRGGAVSDADLSKGLVVLYFYPKDDTPGCTKQACAFRDGIDAFAERGARVYGISADGIESHARFRAKYGINFPLLSDPTHAVCAAFGVWGEQVWGEHRWLGIARTTFVLRDGVVAVVFPNVDVTAHAERVLAAVGALRAG